MKKLLLGILLLFLFTTVSSFGEAVGDVNNDGIVNIVDALVIAQFVVGLNPYPFDPTPWDVDLSGTITIVDALIVAQYSVGLIESLPVGGPTPSPTIPPVIVHYDNPFENASWYVDPLWSANAATGGGSAIAGCNTGIWLNRIADIYESGAEKMSVQEHMNAALEQQADVILFVLNDIPNKDCADYHESGEMIIFEDTFNRYKNEFIDPLAAIWGNETYRDIRIVVIVEPDSLPNLITNLDIPGCAEANGPGGYVDAIRYAVNTLHVIPNVYLYLGIAHSGWLGWDSNFGPAVTLITNCVRGTTSGLDSIDGFISNTALYTPLEEPFLPDPGLILPGGQMSIRSSFFYEWNNYFDEASYVTDMWRAFVAKGFPETIGMLVDTSRNGWGGPDRPTAVSSSTDIDTYVNESRVDRRFHRGNWCNQGGAGIGERPQANPRPFFDAYVWAFGPGISDGVSTPDFLMDPDDPYLRHETMCNPSSNNLYCNCGTTGAITAPHAGRWNQEHFQQLLNNIWPPLY